MVRPERFELPALWFVARCSVQLSYGRVFLQDYGEGIRPRYPGILTSRTHESSVISSRNDARGAPGVSGTKKRGRESPLSCPISQIKKLPVPYPIPIEPEAL